MNNPKLSIIIATFNAAKTLNVALDSVLNQTFQDWECVIVDGASKDNTIEIVKSYTEFDSRIRYISEPDKGIYDAFNKGWKMAKGEWIYYLGADDEVLPEAFSKIFQSPIEDYDIVYGDTIFDLGYKKKIVKSISPEKLKGQMVSHQSILMKKTAIDSLGGFDLQYRICGDFDLIQKAFSQSKLFLHISVTVAVFNCKGISSVTTDNLKEAYAIQVKYKTHPIWYLFFLYKMMDMTKRLKMRIKKILNLW